MRAVVIEGAGGPEVLRVREVPTPEPGQGEVRVRVRAAGVNRADLMQAAGHYPAPPGAPEDIPGLEYAGEVDALGPGAAEASGLRVGDRVFGIVSGGGQAEYVVTHARMAVKIPDNLDFEAAAAVPEAFITAHDALEARGEARPGERVLVQAVGGGVGTAAVQLAHAMGCTVLGTSRTADKLARARVLGLDVGIDAAKEDFAEAVLRATGGLGADVAIDFLGGPAIGSNLKALALKGRLVVVGLLAGPSGTIDLSTLLRRRLTVVGTVLRARPIEEKIEATRAFEGRVVPWLARGLVRPLLDRVFDLDRVGEAHSRVRSNLGFGKVVLRV